MLLELENVRWAESTDEAGDRQRPLVEPGSWSAGVSVAAFDLPRPMGWQSAASPAKDAILLRVQGSDLPRHLSVDAQGTRMACDLLAGESMMLDLSTSPRLWLDGPMTSLHVGWEKATIRAVAERAGADGEEAYDRLRQACTRRLVDETTRELAASLRHSLGREDRCSVYFRTQIVLALASHILRTHAEVDHLESPPRGGLAPWQLKRAQARLLSSLAHAPTLQDVAEECGLSLSHFSRAFRRSVGTSPHAWLNQQRLARAKELMRSTRQPLAEVALMCGFADQSHFTRAFSREVRVSPGAWRRSAGPCAAAATLDRTGS